MKKRFGVWILLLTILCCLSACGTETGDAGKTVPDDNAGKTETVNSVDYDLTKMSSTMVYSQVLNFLNDPEPYIGKTVKARGEFRVGYSSKTGLYYPAVLIADATACCSQGLEFVLRGAPEYPDGYPEVGAEITVTGTFLTYYEDDDRYCHLVRATIG